MSEKQDQNQPIRKNIKVITQGYTEQGLSGNISNQSKPVQQLIQDIDISQCIDQNGFLKLKKLIILIKNQYNFPFQNKQVYFYLNQVQIFMNCGIDPVTQDIRIRPQNYQPFQTLIIKGKDLGISMVHRLMSFENTVGNNQQKQRNQIDDNQKQSKCRRTKQRRIGHIIDKVIQWRKYYAGTTNQKNIPIKYSLQDAARQVKISKKSLDDYLFQIRFGHRYGFNFNEHYNDKVGVLRDFVRQKKKNDKTDNKVRKNQQKNMEKGGNDDYN